MCVRVCACVRVCVRVCVCVRVRACVEVLREGYEGPPNLFGYPNLQ